MLIDKSKSIYLLGAIHLNIKHNTNVCFSTNNRQIVTLFFDAVMLFLTLYCCSISYTQIGWHYIILWVHFLYSKYTILSSRNTNCLRTSSSLTNCMCEIGLCNEMHQKLLYFYCLA